MGFFNKLKQKFTKNEEKTETYKEGMTKTRQSFTSKINDLIARYRLVDEDFFEELEEVLISSDVGVMTVMDLIEELRMEVQRKNIQETKEMTEVISEKLVDVNYDGDDEDTESINYQTDDLTVILVVGVNGVGKTTSIGKLAHQLKNDDKHVVLASGDTFREGVIKQSEGSDPAAVVYDAIRAAKSRKAYVLICDTAGRLQNKVNLMNELEKVNRIITREIPDAPHETLLVLDGTTGQNAMNQAKVFSEATNVTGIILTKLDGTAKGGIVIAIKHELNLPVKLVGFGEGINDLHKFDAQAFVYGLFSDMLDEE